MSHLAGRHVLEDVSFTPFDPFIDPTFVRELQQVHRRPLPDEDAVLWSLVDRPEALSRARRRNGRARRRALRRGSPRQV